MTVKVLFYNDITMISLTKQDIYKSLPGAENEGIYIVEISRIIQNQQKHILSYYIDPIRISHQ